MSAEDYQRFWAERERLAAERRGDKYERIVIPIYWMLMAALTVAYIHFG